MGKPLFLKALPIPLPQKFFLEEEFSMHSQALKNIKEAIKDRK